MEKYDDNLTVDKLEKVGTIVFDEFDEGLRFIIMRGPYHWCAYIGIPLEHPLSGFFYGDLNIDCHCGLTFSSIGGGERYGKPDPRPEGYWWYGWDYGHLGDKSFYGTGKEYEFLENSKNWTIGEVKKDSWKAKYDFKKLMKLSEKIKAKN